MAFGPDTPRRTDRRDRKLTREELGGPCTSPVLPSSLLPKGTTRPGKIDLPGRYDDGPGVEIQTILDRLAKPVLPRHLAAKARQNDEAQAA